MVDRMRGRLAHGSEGSALATVLVLVMVLSVIAGSVLAASALQVRFFRQDVHRQQARYAAEAALEVVLRDLGRTSGAIIETSLEVSASSKAHVTAGSFGALSYATAEGWSGRRHVVLRGVAALAPTHVFDHAVWIGDPGSGLVLTGKTSIDGSVVTGRTGLQTASLRAEPFVGERPGMVIAEDSVRMPAFDTASIDQAVARLRDVLEHRSDSLTIAGRASVPVVRIEEFDFDQESNVPVALVGEGLIRIPPAYRFPPGSLLISDAAVEIGGEAAGHDMIIYARDSIRVGGMAKVSGQLIAGERITIGDQAHLGYPSVVIVRGHSSDAERPAGIVIEGESVVDGMILLPEIGLPDDRLFNEDRRKIEVASHVRGGVYSAANTEIRGTVHGTVATRSFHFYASPSHYVNWLSDAQISRPLRPAMFGLPVGFDGNEYRYVSIRHDNHAL